MGERVVTDTAVAAGSGLGAEVTLLGSEEEGKKIRMGSWRKCTSENRFKFEK